MHLCSHCKKPGIGYIRKQFIGSKLPATCKECGGKVHNNRLKSFLAIIPFIVLWLLARFYLEYSFFYWVSVSGIIITILLMALWVPLDKDKDERN